MTLLRRGVVVGPGALGAVIACREGGVIFAARQVASATLARAERAACRLLRGGQLALALAGALLALILLPSRAAEPAAAEPEAEELALAA